MWLMNYGLSSQQKKNLNKIRAVSYTHLDVYKRQEDDGQTVLITERIIKIHTTATDKDGNKEIEAEKDVTIIDTVTLEDLEAVSYTHLLRLMM